MKRFFLRIALIVILLSSIATNAQAQTIKAEALENFSTATPSTTFTVKIIEPSILPDGTMLYEGAIVSGAVSDVEHARRLKQDGYFEFIPSSITYEGKTRFIMKPTSLAKVVDYVPLKPSQLAGSVIKTAAGYAVKGATQGISFVQGVFQSQDGDRIKSGLTKVYNDSPLAYIEEGSELNLKAGDVIVLVIKEIED